jgi:4-amino-4-deoxy-L-arabinose transferase-like glycosyltransferase
MFWKKLKEKVGCYLLLASLSGLAFLRLRALSPFVDEAVHYWWILRVLEAGEWLRPLNVGKPLEAWLAAPLVYLGGDPLVIMRSLHVLTGLFTVLLTFQIAELVTSSRIIALSSAVLIALCPFLIYLERMALAEIYLCAGGLLVTIATLKFWQNSSRGKAAILGLALLAAAFTKFPIGFIFAVWLPLAFVFASPEERRRLLRPQEVSIALVPITILLGPVLLIALARSRQGLSPGFGLGLLEQQSSGAEIGVSVGQNLIRLIYELEAQLGWPGLLLGGLGVTLGLVFGNRYQRWLTVTGLLPWLGLILIAREWSSRYLLFSIPALIIGAVGGWASVLKNRWVKGLLLAIPLLYFVYQSTLLVLNPPAARWSERDRWGYISGWPSGYGYAEAARYLCSSYPSLPVYSLEVGTAMQLALSLPSGCRIEIRQLHVVDGRAIPPEERRALLLEKCPALLITPDALSPSDELWAHLQYVAGFEKPGSQAQVTLYRCGP